MRYIGYIAIGLDVLLLNAHFIYQLYPASIEWYTMDVAVSLVMMMWIFVSAFSKFSWGAQMASLVWLGINHLWDVFQTVNQSNYGDPSIEWIIFFSGLALIQYYFLLYDRKKKETS